MRAQIWRHAPSGVDSEAIGLVYWRPIRGSQGEIHSGGNLRVCGIEGIPEDRYVRQVHAAILWSDHHDRGIETCAVEIFVENHGAALYPAVGTEWILAHSKDPLDMDPAAQEK